MIGHRAATKLLTTLRIACVAAGLWGCSLIATDQDIPTYLVVPDIQFDPTELQGTASTNITDLWVYSSTDVVGVFPLPAVVPLVEEDLQGGDVTLLAGIRENGLSDRRSPYPFYTTVDVLPMAGPGMRDTLVPVVELVDNVRFLSVEDFETSNVFGSLVGGTGMQRTDDEGAVFEGGESGRLVVDEGEPLVRVRTVEQEYDLSNTAPAFLEMDYRCDQAFVVGLYGFIGGQEVQHPAMVLTATDQGGAPEWNKIYIDLAPVINAQGPADHFEVYVECILEAGRTQGSVGLDNVRILTY